MFEDLSLIPGPANPPHHQKKDEPNTNDLVSVQSGSPAIGIEDGKRIQGL